MLISSFEFESQLRIIPVYLILGFSAAPHFFHCLKENIPLF